MSDIVQRIVKSRTKATVQNNFKAGDTVEVYVRVKEGEKERVQLFKGVVTKLQGKGTARSFTVRKVSDGIGVERTFPFHSPAIEKVALIATGTVRRAKLYYLRGRKGKSARIAFELVRDGGNAQAKSVE